MRSILAICPDLTDGEAQREKNEKEGKENLFLLRLYMGVGMYTLQIGVNYFFPHAQFRTPPELNEISSHLSPFPPFS